ncbi:histidine kinase [Stenotrophomonas panacihumi]|uniref:histidine kinase n=1 Tax=Stenotrophomonas panacihumi TaxID=676599 RepID=A0A0R0APB2_9GAMM|nr:hybrid sensor histidine kinase/response regulator [Stenotrophomonas panacihumi]KRG43722.1 histidine kinase [Stenotrophomonas panacihumi]PTN55470.1 hybrid sensor histidine kinase/response regulator [Stenotrophomonas panacihumi]
MNLVAPTLPPDATETVNVLVVDDVAENLIAMEALLRRDGVRVLCARSGAEALELLLQHEVAVALLDVHMPEMDGFSLAELMRGAARSREVPIIFLTASPSDPMRSFQGYGAGAVDFLHKPIEPHVILGKINVFIELYQQRRLLKLRNESLERALKLNETMMAVLTHDLRTPLSVVLLCAEKLAMQLPPEAPVQRTLGQMESSGLRMARMVEQLLDFSRIRTGGIAVQPGPCHCGEVVQAVLEEARGLHADAVLDVQVEGDLMVHADADRISQIVSNLVGNALIHGGGAPVRIEIDGREGARVWLRVSNRGRIDEDLLPRLFEPFKTRFHASHGLGLGLFIAHQFVLAHGGELTAANVEDEVRFEMRLPRRGV